MKKTYGSIEYVETPVDARFVIAAEPQVMLKMKRVFPKIEQNRAASLNLSATDENCLELLWFCDRYPMRIEKAVAELLKFGKRKHVAKNKRLEKIVAGNYKAPRVKMELPAREYQTVAANLWLANEFLILGDDVGLGKTVSAITGLMDARTLPALVVTMTHLPEQWQKEINRFAPGLFCHIIKGGQPYQLPDFLGSLPDILISNYHKLDGWQSVFAEYCNSVVYDECQELRRVDSNKYRAAANISRECKFTLGMSATPVYNNGVEIFNVANCLKSGVLGERHEFEREWCSFGGVVGNPKAFGAYLQQNFILLRRTRADVGRELEPLTRIIEMVESNDKPIDDMRTRAAELAKIILGKGPRAAKFTASGELDWRLRQATGIGKAYAVASFVRMLVESGEQVVLGGWHRAVYEIWKEELGTLGVAMYTGSESSSQKQKSKQEFVDGKAKVLIISVRSGAGLDGLQHVCKSVVIGELDWSPAVHHQLIGRVHRDGQTEPVMAWFLVSDSGSDPIVSEALGIKRDQARGINDPKYTKVELVEIKSSHTKDLARRFLKGSK